MERFDLLRICNIFNPVALLHNPRPKILDHRGHGEHRGNFELCFTRDRSVIRVQNIPGIPGFLAEPLESTKTCLGTCPRISDVPESDFQSPELTHPVLTAKFATDAENQVTGKGNRERSNPCDLLLRCYRPHK